MAPLYSPAITVERNGGHVSFSTPVWRGNKLAAVGYAIACLRIVKALAIEIKCRPKFVIFQRFSKWKFPI
jgi:hypothetical protein